MKGHIHPITIITSEIVNFFRPYGFEVILGNEIVTNEDNFDSLNIPVGHPARAEFDTFYFEGGRSLRAHMSSLYFSAMKNRKPPVRLLFPGKVFRNEATDATHHHTFHQIDGLVIDDKANLSNLVAILEGLMKSLLGKDLKFRIRSSYFPFTEPSIEMDIKRPNEDWLEMLGAGMINPNVIRYYGLDPEKYQGYAFGIGVDRILNIATGVEDVRYNLAGNYLYLGQF